MEDTLAPWERELLRGPSSQLLHITLGMVLLGMRDILDRFGPDHIVYPVDGCVYVARVEGVRLVPSCIVGQFFGDLGILRLLVTEGGESTVFGGNYTEGACKLRNASGLGSANLRSYLESHGVTVEDDAWRFLSFAQSHQDGGHTWGEAVEVAAQHVEGPVQETAFGRLLDAHA